MPAPEIIHQLVEQFKTNRDAYRSGKYNEAQLRQEFLNPFFEALGWDVSNRKGFSINYREVVHEDSIHIKGSPHAKAPDYAFRLGGVRKFFVEAKKPAEDIQNDRELAYQLKVYAWNVGLPLSILTDFEEFAVYDCRNKPNPSDSTATARILYLNYQQYIEKWDEIENVFSPLAIQKGAFDRYASETTSRKGTTKVDDAFLADIEKWRTLLARNIALRNQHVVNERQLNYAVQMTIDRIIFLRICEDRGIEPENQLLEMSKQRSIYPQLVELYQRADIKYNSGLFHFKQEKGGSDRIDKLTPTLEVDDKVLKEIIKDLYYPCPYIFKEIPVEILGQVYEQFLGKVIRLTPGRQAKIEEKPEVRKAGGVYYTPSYIVDYIVANTVGKLVEGKIPELVSQLKILDPACGSGSFLLGAFQYLIDWHESWYLANDPAKWAKGKQPALLPTEGGGWKLTTAEKKRILVNNIYGVDIDAQAVEVTKLSLLLKVLEEESGQLSLGLERVLPDLGDNIKCGNSLIGWDYFEGQLIPDEKEIERVNPFDWQRNFPQVFVRGGFDAVIGNPPYIRVRIFKEFYPNEANFLESKYFCAKNIWDIYLLFFEKALNIVNPSGFASFIIPIQTLHQPNCESLRYLLLNQTSIISVADLSKLKVFKNVTVKNCVFVINKKYLETNQIGIYHPSNPSELLTNPIRYWPQIEAKKNPALSLKLDLLSEKRNLCEKIKAKSYRLGDICYVTFGLRSCAKGVGQGGKERLISIHNNVTNPKPYMEGREIKRYLKNPIGRFISYIPSEMYSPREPNLFETKKIISQSMLSKMRPIATLDDEGFYVEQSLVCIIPHGIITELNQKNNYPLEFILGIINSQLQQFYFSTEIIDYSLGGGLIHATPGSQSKFLIPEASTFQIEKMIALVERMLDLHKRDPQTPQEADRFQREIAATDAAIDKLVYELYDLTEEEIAIVEGKNE